MATASKGRSKRRAKPEPIEEQVIPEADEAPADAPQAPAIDTDVQVAEIYGQFGAVRVSTSWLGTERTVNHEQQATAAAAFDAKPRRTRTIKKLIDTDAPEWKALRFIRTKIDHYVEAVTLPWIEPGKRIIKLDMIAGFDEQMTAFRDELREAAIAFDPVYQRLAQESAKELGALYDVNDYRNSVAGEFGLDWDFVEIAAPAWLPALDPNLGEKFAAKVDERVRETARLITAEFVSSFTAMVERVRRNLAPTPDGRMPKLYETAVTDIVDFAERYRALNLGGFESLDALVERARSLFSAPGGRDYDIDELRASTLLRSRIADSLETVAQDLEALAMERPVRRVIRPGDAA